MICSSRAGVKFLKKLALTHPPRAQQPGRVYPIAQHVLQYDEALGVHCTNIRDEVFGGAFPERSIEGMLVIQSTDSLDVTAVYTSAAIDGTGEISAHSSIDVEQIVERKRGVDLRIDKSAALFPFPFGALLIHAVLYQIDITNAGAAEAHDLVALDELLLETTNAVGVVDVLTMPLELPPGGQMTTLVEGPSTASFQLKLGDLAAGDSLTARFWVLVPTYVIGSPASATLRNVATVNSQDMELTSGNNTVTVDTQLLP